VGKNLEKVAGKGAIPVAKIIGFWALFCCPNIYGAIGHNKPNLNHSGILT